MAITGAVHASGQEAADSVLLRAGPLSMLFDPATTFLRYVRVGNHELVRAVYGAIRDRNWGTLRPQVEGLTIRHPSEDSFEVAFLAHCRQREIDFDWHGSIVGTPDGVVTFMMDGTARSTFLRNRIGLCVLHPIRELAGLHCAVTHSTGSVEPGVYPRFVSASQPFVDMQAISHEAASGVTAEVRFEGDLFEMEDQRNWIDGSFKTYSTPLSIPYPVEVPKGTKVRQSVTVSISSAHDLPSLPSAEGPITVTISNRGAPVLVPAIGLGWSTSHAAPPSDREIRRLKALNLAHLRVDLHLREPEHVELLRTATTTGQALGVGLEIAVFVTDDAAEQLGTLARMLDEIDPPVVRWLVFHESESSTTARWIALAREHLLRQDSKAHVCAGTNAYFAELNRGEKPSADADGVCFSANPQVHAFDDLSLAETLEGLASTTESARELAGHRPIAVTPITFRARFNPHATGPEPAQSVDELPSQVDVRQLSLFGASWTLGAIAAVANGGASSATFFETTGWRGVMECHVATANHPLFQSDPDSVFPLYHVFAAVGDFAGGEVLTATVDRPLEVAALALRTGERRRYLLANLTPERREIRIHDDKGMHGGVRVKRLNAVSQGVAMREPETFRNNEGELVGIADRDVIDLQLGPHELLQIDPVESARG